MNAALLAVVLLAAPKLAMPEWSRVDVSPELGAFYAAHFAAALRAEGLDVVTSHEIGSLLGIERQRELLGCADEASSCMAELANALGAAAVLKVNVARLADGLRANVAVLSSLDGAVRFETALVAASETRLFVALDQTAAEIARTLNPPVGGRLRRLAFAPAAVGAAGLLVGAVATGLAAQRLGELDRAATYAQAQAVAGAGKTAQQLALAGWVVAGVGATAAVLFYLLGGPRSVAPAVEVVPGGAHAGLRFGF